MQVMKKYSTAHAITLLLGRLFNVSRRNSHILETLNRRASVTMCIEIGITRASQHITLEEKNVYPSFVYFVDRDYITGSHSLCTASSSHIHTDFCSTHINTSGAGDFHST